MNDIELMAGLKQHDPDALAALIEIHSAYIGQIIYNLMIPFGQLEDVEELIADTYLAVWNNAKHLDPDNYSSLKGYIGAVARNRAKDFLKKKRIATLHLDENIMLVADGPETRMLQKEQQAIVRATLEQLGNQDREIFIAYYYQYLSIGEISQKMNMNPETVKSRLARGRKRLKKIMEQEAILEGVL